MIDLKKLRELAEKATPGEWGIWSVVDEEGNTATGVQGPLQFYKNTEGGGCFNANVCETHINGEADAAFIAAANPAAVLALLDRLEAAEPVCEAVALDHDALGAGVCGCHVCAALARWRRVRRR